MMKDISMSLIARVVFCVVILAISACSDSGNSTRPDTETLRTGTTSAGRTFSVIRNTSSGEVALHIDGEAPISLNGESAEGVAADDVRVLEYSSPPHIVGVTWAKAAPRIIYEEYMYFEAGKASTPLIKGNLSYSSYDAGYDWVTTGGAEVDYNEGRVRIVEHVKRETRQEQCYADEKMLVREFTLHQGQAALLECEERYRTRSVEMNEGCPDFSIDDAPWGIVPLTDELWRKRCPALREHSYPL